MRWRMKAKVLALASRIGIGRALYQRVQDLKAARMADADTMLERALDLVSLYRSAAGAPAGRDFVEVGTGWCPWVPLLLRVAGARRIVTIDVNPWLSGKTAVGTTRALVARAEVVAAALDLSPQQVEARLRAATLAGDLAAWLGATGIEHYVSGGFEQAGLPVGSFDAVVSSNVLEHVPPPTIAAIHAESLRILRPGGVVLHRFNPGDHFSGGDASITSANFLQYSQEEWEPLGGAGLAYHNRLRCPQHATLIEESGFEIVYRRTRPDPHARHAIETGRVRVHPDFAGMSAEQLSDDYMWVVARSRLEVIDSPGGATVTVAASLRNSSEGP